MSGRKLTIGLFGFGVVGEGIYQVLKQTRSFNACIKKICIKHADKKREISESIFTTDADEILSDPEINVVVELTNDPEAAYHIVTTAMKNGKSVVSANKKLIAEHLPELIFLQKKYEVSFLYEAAVCASIPVIRNLEEYYDNDMMQGICGIVNGSTNYILTKMLDDSVSYYDALQEAQLLGFAETDPSLDVEGKDAVNKISILLTHAFGVMVHPDKILCKGITGINHYDSVYAAQNNYKIKLIAQAGKLSGNKLASFVLPQFVTPESQLFNVNKEFNGVVIESVFSDKQFLYGKGAGRFPTASAVLSDLSALRYNYKYEYRRSQSAELPALSEDFYFKVYVSFDSWKAVDIDDFEYLEEMNCRQGRQHLVGVISFQKLQAATWFKKPGISVILWPEAVLENLELRKLKQQSLDLAGVKKEDETEKFILTGHPVVFV
jgi:homoserine dehydrogenase